VLHVIQKSVRALDFVVDFNLGLTTLLVPRFTFFIFSPMFAKQQNVITWPMEKCKINTSVVPLPSISLMEFHVVSSNIATRVNYEIKK
jgi:hypothetical protein